jgi:hypothetical protein
LTHTMLRPTDTKGTSSRLLSICGGGGGAAARGWPLARRLAWRGPLPGTVVPTR